MVNISATDAVDRDLVLRVARAVVADLDPRELVVFDRNAYRPVPARAATRREPGEFGALEVMDSLIGGAIAASTAVFGTALAEASERTWHRFAQRLREHYEPADDRPDGPDADLLRELDRIYRVTYDATGRVGEPDGSDPGSFAMKVIFTPASS